MYSPSGLFCDVCACVHGAINHVVLSVFLQHSHRVVFASTHFHVIKYNERVTGYRVTYLPAPLPSQLDLLLQEVNYITYYLGKAGNGASCSYLLRFSPPTAFLFYKNSYGQLLLGYRSSVYIHPSITFIPWSGGVYSAETRHIDTNHTNHTNHKPDLRWSTGIETTNSSFIPLTSSFPTCQANPSSKLRQVSFDNSPFPNSPFLLSPHSPPRPAPTYHKPQSRR
jgi:hypothetical protein